MVSARNVSMTGADFVEAVNAGDIIAFASLGVSTATGTFVMIQHKNQAGQWELVTLTDLK